MITPEKVQERFLNKRIKIERTGKWECWLWCGKLDDKGYAIYRGRSPERQKAHRYSYQLFIGPIPAGLVIDHLCRRRHCINPEHLEPVTSIENIIRGTGPIARYMSGRTHCDRGHLLTEENIYTRPQGWRLCKTCKRGRQRAYVLRQKARLAENTGR